MSEVPPTRMNQQVFKGKKKAAESGHKLLKKKADALKVRFYFFCIFILHHLVLFFSFIGVTIPNVRFHMILKIKLG